MTTPVNYLLDCQYYPNWIQENLGLTADELFSELNKIEFAERTARHMRYRGLLLKRSKFFFVDSLIEVPVYLYPGFSYASIAEEYDLITNQKLIENVSKTIETIFQSKINHVIGTKYLDSQDTIGFHDDKPKTMHKTIPVYIISSGAQRQILKNHHLLKSKLLLNLGLYLYLD
jgi:hypothetical protein